MTLIAGLKCSDGIVVAADTEHTFGSIRFQDHKLLMHPSTRAAACHPSGLKESPFRVVAAGAGSSDYIRMTTDEIRDHVGEAPADLNEMSAAVRSAVEHTHETIFKHWSPSDPGRPSVALVVGLRHGTEVKLLRTSDVAVSEVETVAFDGSGAPIAHYLAAGLYRPRHTSTVALNITVQVFRAVKESGIYVGGNTELCILGQGSVFHVTGGDTSYLWGLQAKLHRAIRVILEQKPEEIAKHFIQEVGDALEAIRKESGRFETPYKDWFTVEGNTDVDDPLEDVW